MAQPTTVLTPFQTTASVGVTAMMNALPANPTRKGLIIANNGALTGTPPEGPTVNVTFGPGSISAPNTPSATTGVPIAAGQTFSMLPAMADNVSMGAQVNAIASAAATPVTFLEF